MHAGVEQKLASDRVRVTADYFDSRFHNIISFLNRSRRRRRVSAIRRIRFGAGTFFNTNLARARGANFSGEARITRWLSAQRELHVRFHAHALRAYRSLNLDPELPCWQPPAAPAGQFRKRHAECELFRRMNWNLSGYFTGQRFDYNFPGQIINPGYARFDLAAILQGRARFQRLRPHRQSRQQAISGSVRLSRRSGASFASA